MNLSAARSLVRDPHWRRALRWLLVALCVALLGWMVWKAGPSHLWQTLCSMPLAIGLSVAVWGIGYLLNAASFSQVIRGVVGASSASSASDGPSFLHVLRLTVSGYAINYITPFGLLGGEPYRVLMLKRSCGTQCATQSVVLYSMMHVASHFCFWLLSLFVALAMPTLWQGGDASIGIAATEAQTVLWLVVLTLVFVALLLLLWRLYRRGIALRFLRRWVDWPLLNPSLLSSASFLRALSLELASRLVNVVEYWLIMQWLGYSEFGYAHALLVVAFSSLLANVLFFSPLQMGTREGGILLALQGFMPGQLLPVALTLSFATRIREFVWIAIGLAIMRLSGKDK